MPRLIDDIRAGRVAKPWFVAPRLEDDWAKHTANVFSLMREEQLPVLLIDNVAEYYYASDQEHWDLGKDFPNLAPPYERWWAEHRMPTTIYSKEKGTTDMSRFLQHGRVGILVIATEAKDAQGTLPANAKWILWCELFIDYGSREYAAQGTHGSIFLAIDEHGAALATPWMQTYAEADQGEELKCLMTWLHPMLLAVSFLHCKNVTVLENPVPPKLAKRYRERHGVTPRAYKTLVIEPLKQILRTQGRSDSVGLAKAMHICRGHFKDYREGRGLFGKYHQLVWQPSLVRGSKGKAAAREVEIKV